MKNETAITLQCDQNGDFLLILPGGKYSYFYTRDQWNECNKRMQSLIRPAAGDPK
jgi:hypothetical protein